MNATSPAAAPAVREGAAAAEALAPAGPSAPRRSQTSAPRRSRRRIGTALAAAALALGGLFLAAPAAQAHDELISSDPSDGQALEATPDAITLSFSADITPVGNAVRVTDSSGETVSTGDVEVNGTDAVQRIDSDASDETYRVVWRVVSSDGHPIEGSYSFSVGTGGTGGAELNSSATPSATPSLSGSADDAAQDQDASGVPTWVVVLIGVVTLVVVLVIVGIVLARVRASRRD